MNCPHCQAPNEAGAEVCFTCGRAFQALTQGAVVSGRYEVQSLLGRGGMGAVYRAHDRVLDETVALKVLRVDFASDDGLQKRFLQEIKLARKISHRNVCRIHEYGEDNGLRYISMAYVDGVDLKRLLRQGPLPAEEAFDAMVQVAEGLSAIHDEGVLHRDLKTPNILRDNKGVVRLLDFGIAKEWEAPTEQGLTGTGLIVGTPEYMSPEQVLGRKLDARSDLYSLGIVIYEVFTAQLPFKGDSTVSLLQKQVNQPPPLQGPEAARLPRPLIPVLRRVLAKEPPLRYGSALELADALREAWTATRALSPRNDEDLTPTAPPRAYGGSDASRPPATREERAGGGTPPSVPAMRTGGTRTPITDPAQRLRPTRVVPSTVTADIEDDEEPARWPVGWIGGGAVAVILIVLLLRQQAADRRARMATPSPTPTVASEVAEDVGRTASYATATPYYEATQEPIAIREEATRAPEAATAAPTTAAEESRDPMSEMQAECSRGSMQACANLGDAYQRGQGVRQDLDRAVSFYERACERDHAAACQSLGRLYLHGTGVSRDPDRAASYLKRACSAGESDACRVLEELAARHPGGPGGPGGGGRPAGGPPPGGRR